jgi:hypothetical protein
MFYYKKCDDIAKLNNNLSSGCYAKYIGHIKYYHLNASEEYFRKKLD